MSARDKFVEVLRSRGMMRPGEEWVIDANLNAHAHELAERIRAEQDRVEEEERDRFGRLDPETVLQGEAVRARADLIDPEAQQ